MKKLHHPVVFLFDLCNKVELSCSSALPHPEGGNNEGPLIYSWENNLQAHWVCTPICHLPRWSYILFITCGFCILVTHTDKNYLLLNAISSSFPIFSDVLYTHSRSVIYCHVLYRNYGPRFICLQKFKICAFGNAAVQPLKESVCFSKTSRIVIAANGFCHFKSFEEV